MNRKQLVDALAAKTGASKKDADAFVSAFQEVVVEALKSGDSVTLTGFGVFKVVERPARQARNPRTGQPIDVPARKVPQFKPGKGLKESVK